MKDCATLANTHGKRYKVITKSSAVSHTGKLREVNEDAYLCRDTEQFWLVADGMGGHSKGDEASQKIVEAFSKVDLGSSLEERISIIDETLKLINSQLFKQQETTDKVCGSTIIIFTIIDGLACIVWAGDSRAYLVRDTLKQLMTDHSHVQGLLQRGTIEDSEVEYHPMANVITRAVGAEQYLQLEFVFTSINRHDRFLICSDGLSKELDVETLFRLSKLQILDCAASELLDATLKKGASDNVTLILIEVCGAPTHNDQTKWISLLNQELKRFDIQVSSGHIDLATSVFRRQNLLQKFSEGKLTHNNETVPASSLGGDAQPHKKSLLKGFWLIFILAGLGGLYVIFG